MLAASIKGVVSQVLLREKGGKGRCAAQEIMVGTNAVRALIREGKIHQIPSMIRQESRMACNSWISTFWSISCQE